MNKSELQDSVLEHEHTKDAIARRLLTSSDHQDLGDFMLGAVDGTITTFAIVSGVAGAGLSTGVALVLGLANVLADGLSMAVGNYLKARSDAQTMDRLRHVEEKHIKLVPEGEQEEIRQIFSAKGFSGDLLEQIVEVITRDRKRWVDTMLREEWGLPAEAPKPWRAGAITFLAFVLAGLIPLAPLVALNWFSGQTTFVLSAVATATTFLLIGALRGRLLGQSSAWSALETLGVGGVAAAAAYLVGAALRDLTGIS